MITKEMYFYSNGYKLKAALYLPDGCEEGEKIPCIIPNSGYMGLNEIYPALYARALTARGCAAFGFDYRGFLDNGGPAGVCKLEEQVEDIRNAVVFVKTLAQVDADRIGLIGWGMAAGLVMEASAREPSVRAVAGLNGFYNSRKWLQSVYRYADYVALENTIAEERTRFVTEGTRRFDNPFVYYPLDPATDNVVKDHLYVVKGYGQDISLDFGQSLLDFNAEDCADKLDIPVFIGHGRDNLLHPVGGSVDFYNLLNCEKRLYMIDGKHNDFMFDDHPVFHGLVEQLDAFFSDALKA
jgi:pimeloyl-ACP methyl ester carboxylesterase